MKIGKILIALTILGAASGLAKADYIAYDVKAGLVGNQSFGGSLGLDFNVTSNIWINALGAFDSGGDGLSAAHTVQLYDRVSQKLLLEAVIPAGTGATLINGSRFVTVESFPLVPGGQYTIVASGFTNPDPFYNTFFNSVPPSTENGGPGLITFVGSGRYSATPNTFPTTVDTRPQSNPYAAGTFGFTTVPEPGSIALFGLGAVGIVLARRRRTARVEG